MQSLMGLVLPELAEPPSLCNEDSWNAVAVRGDDTAAALPAPAAAAAVGLCVPASEGPMLLTVAMLVVLLVLCSHGARGTGWSMLSALAMLPPPLLLLPPPPPLLLLQSAQPSLFE